MGARQIFNPEGFKNMTETGEVTGYCFQMKAQYYRGFTLSILRGLDVETDGEAVPRENIRIAVSDAVFTMEEIRTVIDPDYRWEFGEYATVIVRRPGGLAPGAHRIRVLQTIAPSYMPFEIKADCVTDFTIA